MGSKDRALKLHAILLKGDNEIKKTRCIFIVSAFVMLVVGSTWAYPQEQIENTMVALSLGDRFAASDIFKQIYGSGGCVYSLELSRIILKRGNHNFALSLRTGFFSRTGASTLFEEKTKFYLVPSSISGKYLLNSKYMIPFVELGLGFYSYREESEIHDTSGSTLAWHMGCGTYIKSQKLKFLKLIVYVKKARAIAVEDEIEVDIGGLELGAGIVIGFNWLSQFVF